MRNFLKTDRTTTDDETLTDENGDPATSLDTTPPDSDERPASTGLADENESAAEPTVDPDSDIDDDRPKPTFTPASEASANGGPVTTVGSDPAGDDGNFTRAMPTVTSAADEPVTDLPADEPVTDLPADEPVAAVPMDEPVASIRADEPVAASTTSDDEPAVASTTEGEPLLANTELMRASWQQVQAGFVDDPKAAVSDAADLIDNTVQALVETLQQRQRQLRDMSGSGTANGASNSAVYGSAASSGVPDTEQLRLVMQRYRSLFNQLVGS
jgi:hypothetical protein